MNNETGATRWSRLTVQVLVALVLVFGGLLVGPRAARAETVSSWTGYYYSNSSLSGYPVLTRTDATLDMNWGTGSPDGAVPADWFSAQWAGSATLDGGTYTFSAWADDGIRVWVDDVILINEWHNHLPTTYTGTRYLAPGYHSIRVAYYEATGNASLQVSWTRGTPPPATGTTIVVDDRSPGFVWGGPSSGWHSRQWGYNGWLYWTGTAGTAPTTGASGIPTWRPPAITKCRSMSRPYANATRANYVVNLNGAQHVRTVNQAIYSNQWISLGSFWFQGGAGEFVYLSDFTGEAHVSRVHRL